MEIKNHCCPNSKFNILYQRANNYKIGNAPFKIEKIDDICQICKMPDCQPKWIFICHQINMEPEWIWNNIN